MPGEREDAASVESVSDAIVGHAVLEVADVERALDDAPGMKRGRWTLVFVPVFVLALVPGMLKGGVDRATFTIILPFAFLVVLVFSFLRGMKKAAVRALEGKDARQLDTRYEFSSAGYSLRTPASDVRAEWSTVLRYHEGASAFLIYPSAMIYQVIPKRALREEDIPRLRELLRVQVKVQAPPNHAVRVLVVWVVLIAAFLGIWQLLKLPGDSAPARDDTTEE